MLRKKPTKPNSVWLSLFIFPLIFLTAVMQLKTQVFSLSFDPLNITTNLTVVEDTLLSQSIDDYLTIENLPRHSRYEVRIYISGFTLLDETATDLPAIVVDPYHAYGRIEHLSTMGWYRLSARTDATGVISVRIQNFAIIDGRTYGFFIQELLIEKRGL